MHFLRDYFRQDNGWDAQSFAINLLDMHEDFQLLPDNIPLQDASMPWLRKEKGASVETDLYLNYDLERFRNLKKIRLAERQQLLDLAQHAPDKLLNSMPRTINNMDLSS
jgi:hypothetical protein